MNDNEDNMSISQTSTAHDAPTADSSGSAPRKATMRIPREPALRVGGINVRQSRVESDGKKREVYSVVVDCGKGRANADRVQAALRALFLAHRQARREAGGVRLNELSDVMRLMGLCLDLRPRAIPHDAGEPTP